MQPSALAPAEMALVRGGGGGDGRAGTSEYTTVQPRRSSAPPMAATDALSDFEPSLCDSH
eukprot:COSAG01_NODE_2662_length_7295_cov_5.483324_1_plen_59_part_10